MSGKNVALRLRQFTTQCVREKKRDFYKKFF